jgi:hypothetical protein
MSENADECARFNNQLRAIMLSLLNDPTSNLSADIQSTRARGKGWTPVPLQGQSWPGHVPIRPKDAQLQQFTADRRNRRLFDMLGRGTCSINFALPPDISVHSRYEMQEFPESGTGWEMYYLSLRFPAAAPQ